MDCQDCLSFFETVGNAFNSPIDTNELLQLITDTLVKRFKVDGCAIWLLSRDRRTLDDVASSGLSQKFKSKGPIDSERSVAEALDGKIVSITDCPNDPRIQYKAAFAEEGILSLLAVPLAARGQVIGVLRLYAKRRVEFPQSEKDVFKVAASFCACAVLHSMFQKILHDVSGTVRSSLVLDEVLQGIVKVITEDLRAKGALDLAGASRHEEARVEGFLRSHPGVSRIRAPRHRQGRRRDQRGQACRGLRCGRIPAVFGAGET